MGATLLRSAHASPGCVVAELELHPRRSVERDHQRGVAIAPLVGHEEHPVVADDEKSKPPVAVAELLLGGIGQLEFVDPGLRRQEEALLRVDDDARQASEVPGLCLRDSTARPLGG